MERKRAFVTGASSGLGRALAETLYHLEYHVVGTTHDIDHGLDEPTFPSLLLEWQASHGIESLMTKLEMAKVNGPFDVVINNAGINAIRPFRELTQAFIDEIMNVNFVTPVLLTQQLMARERLVNYAVIVNIISDAAWRPMRHSLAYNCSKAALDMATRQMARELTKVKPYPTLIGIRPGFMEGTAMSDYIEQQVCALRGWTPEQARAYAASNRTANCALDHGDVASLIGSIIINDSVHAMSGACIDLAG